jgi:DNA-binding CsgD family transcriptional regulator
MRLLSDPAFLNETLGEIYDCVLDAARWQVLLPKLGDMIGARRVAMGVVDQTGATQAGYVVMHGYPSVERVYQYAALNPVLPLTLTWPLDRSFVVSRDMGPGAITPTRYWREYLAPQGDADVIAFTLTREGDEVGNWLLCTQDDRPPITEAEAQGFELVAPHIRRAVEISRIFGAHQAEAATSRAALDALDAPVLIMDGQRRLVFANPSAAQALEEGRVMRLRAGRLAGATDPAERVLRRVAETGLAGGAAGFEATIPGTDGEDRLLFAVALDAGGPIADASRQIMLVLRAPRADTRNPVAIAAQLFRLTPAQIQVLAFLAQGHAPDAIAEILGISTTTVRSHLADLFGKTGTTRQAELVARTLSLASPLRGPATPGG